jgi:hypothetical protein
MSFLLKQISTKSINKFSSHTFFNNSIRNFYAFENNIKVIMIIIIIIYIYRFLIYKLYY